MGSLAEGNCGGTIESLKSHLTSVFLLFILHSHSGRNSPFRPTPMGTVPGKGSSMVSPRLLAPATAAPLAPLGTLVAGGEPSMAAAAAMPLRRTRGMTRRLPLSAGGR